MMEPAIITFAGDLELARYPEVHAILEAAKLSKGRSLVLDLSAADHVDPLIAGELVLFIRRSLRYGAQVAIVPPHRPNDWLTHAGSIRDAHFRQTREEAVALVGGAAP
jgi:anti-anti-sigma regulatory factor